VILSNTLAESLILLPLRGVPQWWSAGACRKQSLLKPGSPGLMA